MSDEPTGPKQGHRWTRGTSGNPRGRAKGSRNEALRALDAIGMAGAESVMHRVVAAAASGDMRAAEILLRRVWPERRGRPVTLDLPTITSAGDIVQALGAIAGAVATGELTAEEGAGVANILETQRRALETVEIERRLAMLEQANMERGR